MRAAMVSLVVISALHGINHTFSIFLSPLNEEIRIHFGVASISAITALKTTYLFVYALSNLGAGLLANRVSARLVLSLGLVLNGLAIAAFSLVPGQALGLMHVLWAIAGIGGGVYHPLAMALVTNNFPRRKGWALGITGVGAGLGFAFGPLISQVLAQNVGFTWQQLALIFGLTGAAFAAVSLSTITDAPRELGGEEPASGAGVSGLEAEPAPPAVPGRVAAAGADTRRGAAGASGVAWAFLFTIIAIAGTREITMWSILDVSDFYLERVFTGRAPTGFFLFLLYIPGVIVQPIVGNLSDRGHRNRIAAVTMALYGAAVLLIAVVPVGLLWLVFLTMGAAQTATVPTVDALVADATPDHGRGVAFGVFVTFGIGIGSTGPLLFGLVVDALGGTVGAFHATFVALAALLGLGAIGMLVAGRQAGVARAHRTA